MRLLTVLAALAAPPALAAPAPLCATPAPIAMTVADQLPPPILPEPAPPPALRETRAASALPEAVAAIPFVQHVASAGAVVTDLGASHGVRSIAARSGDQFMIFQVAPDGQAAVSGAMTELTATQLSTIAGGNTTDLGVQHGFQGIFVRSGPQFQVFYATPDKERLIPGVLWDASGNDLTRQQVSNIPGAIPTVVVGSAEPGKASAAPGAVAALPLVQKAQFGTVGPASAPHLWMLADPQCIYSVRAFQMLQPYVANGRVQLSVIPVSVLDYENKGQSTRSALALLSKPADRMVMAWQSGDVTGAASPEAADKLRANMAIAQAVGLQGTPTFVWRKTDGSEGRIDGIPTSVEALLASIGS
jgi:thiol:disulfide interchange protein DsbG